MCLHLFLLSNLTWFEIPKARLFILKVLCKGLWVGYLTKTTFHKFDRCILYRLMAAKSATFSAISNSNRVILNVLTEVTNHKTYCAQWGITESELDETSESSATTAYGAYILDVGLQG